MARSKAAPALDMGWLRCGPWFSPSAQIEYETRIAYRFPPETGWCGLAPIQELLNFTQ